MQRDQENVQCFCWKAHLKPNLLNHDCEFCNSKFLLIDDNCDFTWNSWVTDQVTEYIYIYIYIYIYACIKNGVCMLYQMVCKNTKKKKDVLWQIKPKMDFIN